MSLASRLDNIRSRPQHERRNIAYTSALAIAVVLGLAWFGGNLAAGTYALSSPSADDIAAAAAQPTASANDGGLLGAVSAAFVPTTTPPHIDVVGSGIDTSVNAPPAPTPEQTVIPF